MESTDSGQATTGVNTRITVWAGLEIDRLEEGLDLPHLGKITMDYIYYPDGLILNMPVQITGEDDVPELSDLLEAWRAYHQRKYGKPTEATDEPAESA